MANSLSVDLFEDEYVSLDLEDIGLQGIDPDEEKTASEEETPEEVAGKEEADEDTLSKSGSESLPNLYSSLAKALGEEGFLPDLDKYDEIDNFEKLGDRIREANKKALTDSLGFNLDNIAELSDLQKQYLRALNEGVPAETFIEAKRDEVSIDSITSEAIEADEELRRSLIVNSYVAKGVPEVKAAKLAQMHIDLAEDVEEAKAAVADIKEAVRLRNEQEFAYQKQLREDSIKQQKEYEESLKKHFFNTEKIGETFDVPRQLRDKMYEAITKPVAKLEDGTLVNAITKLQMENPVDFQHKIAWLYAITDGFKKFDSFVSQKAMSKATQQLESVLNSTNFDKMGNVSNPEPDDDAVYGFRDYSYDEEA